MSGRPGPNCFSLQISLRAGKRDRRPVRMSLRAPPPTPNQPHVFRRRERQARGQRLRPEPLRLGTVSWRRTTPMWPRVVAPFSAGLDGFSATADRAPRRLVCQPREKRFAKAAAAGPRQQCSAPFTWTSAADRACMLVSCAPQRSPGILPRRPLAESGAAVVTARPSHLKGSPMKLNDTHLVLLSAAAQDQNRLL